MFQRANDKDEILFRSLASSGTVLSELIKYWRSLNIEAREQLEILSVAALLKPEIQPQALIQYGRAQMLKELIDHAEKYKRSE